MGLDAMGIGALSDFAKDLIDKIFPNKFATQQEKDSATLALAVEIDKHEESTVNAQRDIIVAEMNQQDKYTKRARPTIVYAGLLFIFLVHVFFPFYTYWTKETVPVLALPDAFWYTWGGVCGVWILGRSYEKANGVADLTTGLITGNSK